MKYLYDAPLPVPEKDNYYILLTLLYYQLQFLLICPQYALEPKVLFA